MTIADMSLITAEVKVDETDIVNVKLGPEGGHHHRRHSQQDVQGPRDRNRQHGDSALHRPGGFAERDLQPGSQGFQGGGRLDDPPDEIRPGPVLHREDHHRHAPERADDSDPGADRPPEGRSGGQAQDRRGRAWRPPSSTPAAEKARKEEIQGVFVVAGGKAEFRKVETGITGATDIEVLSGLKEGDEIVTGSYQVIRTMRNEAR